LSGRKAFETVLPASLVRFAELDDNGGKMKGGGEGGDGGSASQTLLESSSFCGKYLKDISVRDSLGE